MEKEYRLSTEEVLSALEKTQLLFTINAYGAAGKMLKKPAQHFFQTPSIKAALNYRVGRYDLSHEKHIIIICGHYEGFDERIRTLCDMELSIGDYVLTGGELPAMVISDSIIRLLDGVITGTSLDSESFNDKLLDYPTYTKPQEFMGMKVPDVLLSGDHAKIKTWRREMRIKRTKERRPDLID